jgi:MFS family permease
MFYRHHRRRFHRHHHRSLISTLTIIDILWGFGVAAFLSTLALYLNTFDLTESQIGFITGSLTILVLFTSLLCVSLLERYHKLKIIIITSLLVSSSYILMAFTNTLFAFLCILLILVFSETLFYNTFQILFKDSSKSKEYSKNIGLMYGLESIGWIVSPLLAGIILERFGFSWVFLIAALFPLLGLSQLRGFKLKDAPHTQIHGSILALWSHLRDFFSQKKLHLSYIFGSSIGFWWDFLYIYPPLFLVTNGYSAFWVGVFIGAINIPTLIFEYLAGKQVKNSSHRHFFLIGYTSMGILAILCYFVDFLPLALVLLVLASIPLSYVEPLQPTYFFSLIKKKDEEKFFPIFDTSYDVGSMMGKFLPALILLVFPQNVTFLFVGLCMLAMAGLSLRVRN